MHLFGRVRDAKYQIFPESVYLPAYESGFYNKFKPLNNEDILEIQKQIKIILEKKKYKFSEWTLI
jgi:hypothetical protein